MVFKLLVLISSASDADIGIAYKDNNICNGGSSEERVFQNYSKPGRFGCTVTSNYKIV